MKTIVIEKSNKNKNKKKLRYQSNISGHSFLKYWRVVNYWARRKYNLTSEEIHILLYLYDEDLFTVATFKKFEGLLHWDKFRLQKLIKKELVVLWRDHSGYNRQARLYTLSFAAKRICNSIYKKLLHEQTIPEAHHHNPIFKGNGYADKMYRKAIKEMNVITKKKRADNNPL